MNIDETIARGYIVLLSGGPPGSKQSVVDASTQSLAFAAILEGNVVDACFGVHASTKRDSPNRKAANNVKAMIAEASAENDDIQKLAIEAYQQAFESVLQFSRQVKNLNILTFCFLYNRIQRDAEVKIEEAFVRLQEAILTTKS